MLLRLFIVSNLKMSRIFFKVTFFYNKKWPLILTHVYIQRIWGMHILNKTNVVCHLGGANSAGLFHYIVKT